MSITATGNLVVVSENGKGRSCAVGADREAVIGRTEDCDLCLSDGRVSRRHCVIAIGVNGFAVRDLGSVNGTFVNGRRVAESPLGKGDRLKVGFTEMEFQTDAVFPGPDTTRLAPAQLPTEPIIAAPVRAPASAKAPGFAEATPGKSAGGPASAVRNRIAPAGKPKIDFCTRCAVSIPPADMKSGRARVIDGQLFCPECLASETTSIKALRAVRGAPRAPGAPASARRLPSTAAPAAPASRPATRPSARTAPPPPVVVSARAALKTALASTAAGAAESAEIEKAPVPKSKRAAAVSAAGERPAVPLKQQLWAYGSLAVTLALIALCAVNLPDAWLNFQRLTSPSRIGLESVAPEEAKRGFFGVSMKDTLKAEDGREVKATQSGGIIARMKYDDLTGQAKAMPGGVAKFEVVYDKRNPLRSALRDKLGGVPTLLVFLLAIGWAAKEIWQISKFYRRPAVAKVAVRK